MKITIIGGGNGGFAAAADLSEQGHEIRLWRRDPGTAAATPNPLMLRDHRGRRRVQIDVITADVAAALNGAELIVCPTPATSHFSISSALAPHLRSGQVVFLPPGTFGSLIFARALREAGNDADVAFAEAGTLPYLARKHGPDAIAITTRATRLPTGVFPLAAKDRALSVIRRAYPSVEDAGDALSGALMNAGPIIHPPLILMNAGPIEHFGHWDIHNEGTQPAIRRVTDALDAERIAVREALGYRAPHFPLRDHYGGGDEWMYGALAHEKLTDSGDWRESLVLTEHRYMREDVAVGLSFLTSVADWAGVAAPVASGLLALGSAVCGEDLRRSGRTLTALRLGHLARDEMAELLSRGL